MVRLAILGTGPAADACERALGTLGGLGVLAGRHEDPAADLDALLARADAVVVASAPELAAAHAERALKAGLDVLLEPAPADTLREVQAAAARTPFHPVLGVALDALHDPAVRALGRMVGDSPVFAMEATALEPFDDAPGHLDVTDDLLLGPLQAVLAVAGRPPAAIQAAGRRVRRAQGIDHAAATLLFDDDLLAVLTVGRAGCRHVRRLVVETRHARVTADLRAGVVRAERDVPGHGLVVECPPVAGPDARTAHLASFLTACRDRRPADVGIGVALGLLDVAGTVRRRVDLMAHRPAGHPLRAA